MDETATTAAPENAPPARSKKAQVAALQADWRRRWPAAFGKPVPLAVGTARQIKEQLGPSFTQSRLVGLAFHLWTMQSAYLSAIARGDMRRNLDGSEAGLPDDAARQQARALLDERKAKQAAAKLREQEKALEIVSSAPP